MSRDAKLLQKLLSGPNFTEREVIDSPKQFGEFWLHDFYLEKSACSRNPKANKSRGVFKKLSTDISAL